MVLTPGGPGGWLWPQNEGGYRLSNTDTLVGSGSTVDGGSRTWSMVCVGSGLIFVACLGVERSAAEDLSCHPGHSGLLRLVLSGVGSKIAAVDGTCVTESKMVLLSLMTPTVREVYSTN